MTALEPDRAGDEAGARDHQARPRTLFRVPFRSTMSDHDARRLSAPLDMALCLKPTHPSVRPPLGVARLDFASGLFLVRGEAENEWALEGRTWGDPAPALVREWQLQAILCARRVDSSVAFPMPPRPRPQAPRRGVARLLRGPAAAPR